MNKKTLILGISALVVLSAVIGFAISMLYSDRSNMGAEGESVSRQYHLVEAVPSDAAIVFFSDNFKDVIQELADSTTVLGNVFTDPVRHRFSHFLKQANQLRREGDLKSLANRQAIISLHYSGNMMPLLIVEAGNAANPGEVIVRLQEMAAKEGLYSSYLYCPELVKEESPLSHSALFLVSPSETLLLSSRRHLESGDSIMDADGFTTAVSHLRGEDAIAISHNYAGKFLKSYCSRKWLRTSDFFRSFSNWTLFTPEDFSGRSFKMNGVTSAGTSISYYANVLDRTPAGESDVAAVLPRQTSAVLSLAFDDCQVYLDQFQNYLDAQENLSDYKVQNQRLKSKTSIAVDSWAGLLDVKEVAKVTFRSGEKLDQVLLTRIKKENQDILLKGLECHLRQVRNAVVPYAYGGYVSAAFGKAFALEEESHFTMMDNWIISGTAEAVEAFGKLSCREGNLLEDLTAAGIFDKSRTNHVHLFAYASFIEDREAIRSNFSQEIQQSMDRSLNGMAAFPIVFDITDESEGGLCLHYSSARLEQPLFPEAEPVVLDTVVHIDKGPYQVKNCATGKMNLLVQNPNHSITMRDENGKGQWSIPFSHPICGKVETIDYYGNGKLQFLFGAGNSLYLLDRLGRFVKSFPVRLDREILLGPAAYDFTGAHGYKAMILFKDNTIDMLNLHGQKPEKWQGIKDSDTILKLPELLKVGEHQYWVVRTARQTLIYPFYGGEPVFRREGSKMLRPDTEVLVKGGSSVSVVCHDGKKHTVKLK